MKCPICNKKLTKHYKTIYTCENKQCVMLYAILSIEQWKEIIKNPNIKAH